MLSEISLKGFKSFLDRRIGLKDLTLLTGLNSSGKSSVIQALLILEKACKRKSNILLEGHGSIDEIRNIFVRDEISLTVTNDKNEVLQLNINQDSAKNPYEIIKSDRFTYPSITYISASRFGPKTSVPLFHDRSRKDKIGPNGENVFQCIQTYADTPLDARLKHPNSEGETLIYNIRGWLSVIAPNIKFDYKIDNLSDSSYSLFDNHRAANVGFGLSYSLPVITALLVGTLNKNSLIIIENPEAHLHPKGQTAMAELISLCAQVGTQIIIETHSDHLFDGIRIATKKTPQLASKVQLHWFELNSNRLTEVYSPVINEDGRVDQWPPGFFDQFEINASNLF